MAIIPRPLVPATGAAVLIAAALVLSGCSASPGAAQPEPSADQSTAQIDATADYDSLTGPIDSWPQIGAVADVPDLTGSTVWYVPMVGGIPTMATIGAGMESALANLGVTTKTCDGQGLPTAIADCLRKARAQSASAVVTSYIDYNVAASAFEELVDAGIPVLLGGVAPSADRPAGHGLAYFEQEIYNGKIFELAASAVVAANADGGDVLWVRAMDTPTTQRASDAGIERLGELCPSCTVKTVDASTPQLDKLASEVSAALVAAPGVSTVFVPMDAYVPTVSQGIASAGKQGRLAIVSTGADLAGLQRIAGGQQTIDLGVPPVFTGWSFAHALVQHLAGAPVSVQDETIARFFNADNVEDLQLDSAGYASPDWYGDDAYKDAYLTAWGAK